MEERSALILTSAKGFFVNGQSTEQAVTAAARFADAPLSLAAEDIAAGHLAGVGNVAVKVRLGFAFSGLKCGSRRRPRPFGSRPSAPRRNALDLAKRWSAGSRRSTWSSTANSAEGRVDYISELDIPSRRGKAIRATECIIGDP